MAVNFEELSVKYSTKIEKMQKLALKAVTSETSESMNKDMSEELMNEKIQIFVTRTMDGELQDFEKELIANENLTEEEAHGFVEYISANIRDSLNLRAIDRYKKEAFLLKYIVPVAGVLIIVVAIVLIICFVLTKQPQE